MELKEINQYLGKTRFQGNETKFVTGFAIDSRQLKPGNLFFALSGEQVDGHQFVVEALKRGASGAVVSQLPLGLEPKFLDNAGLIVVPDTLKALQKLALNFRLQLGLPVVGVTGSSGKTTTKDLVAAVLAAKYQVLKTEGNFNNQLGLPLTLLGLKEHHQVAVLEMGMRGLGQIKELCEIAVPDYGLITNIGTAHFELLGSEEKIAAAKGELLTSLPDGGVAILNRDDPWSIRLGEKLREARPLVQVIYYGLQQSADYHGCQLKLTEDGTEFTIVGPQGSTEAFIPLYGSHNVQNALAALAVGSLFQIPLEMGVDALANVKISEKRLARRTGNLGSIVLDDTYNANPRSTIASLEVLASLVGGRKIAVLGSQRELGCLTEKGHREVGQKVTELKIDYLLTVGDEANWIAEEAQHEGMSSEQIHSFRDNKEAILLLQKLVNTGDVVLVKGSRALAMEEIVAAITVADGGAKK